MMARVSIVILPSLAETLGMDVTSEEVVSDQDREGGESVRNLLNRLGTRDFRFGHLVFNLGAQKLTDGVIIFLNGRALEPVDGLETNLHDGDTLTIVPVIEGG